MMPQWPRAFGERFVARGKVAKTPDELHYIKQGDEVWLSWTSEAGGWFQWDKEMNSAYPFADRGDCLREAKQCKGPWYYEPSQESVEVIEVEYHPPEPHRIVIKPHTPPRPQAL